MEGVDDFFVGVGEDYAILHVSFYTMDEKGLESVFHVSGVGWGGDKILRWTSGLENSGKKLCGDQGEGVMYG